MDKADLASKLRQCQRDLGQVAPHLIDVLPDDVIIDCYVTCSCCGERMVSEQMLELAIRDAKDEQDFLRLIGDFSCSLRRAKKTAEEGWRLWKGLPPQRPTKKHRRKRRA